MSHVYETTIQGQTVRLYSVTGYIGLFRECGLLSSKPYYGNGEAAQVGTGVHGYISQILSGKPIKDNQWQKLSEKEKNAILSFLRWREAAGFKVRDTEVKVYSLRFSFGGTLDAVGFVRGKLTILDWKTGIVDMDSLKMQTVLYYVAYLETFPRRVIRKLSGVFLDKATGQFNEINIDVAEIKTIFNQFLEMQSRCDIDMIREWSGTDKFKFRSKKIGGIS